MKILTNLIYLAGMAGLAFYIANPGAGVFELIPDNLPVIGNLDEAAAVGALIALFKRWRKPALPPGSEPGQRDDSEQKTLRR
jgi:uncharacterized membrane protein YkvA (DUF1232 family)